jgi:hypothetical protein
LFIGVHSSMFIDMWGLGVEFQAACSIVLTNSCTQSSMSLLAFSSL